MRWLSAFGFGLLPTVIVLTILVSLVAAIVIVARLLWRQHTRARAFGYTSMAAYLRAAPVTDEERRDAVDLAMKGGAICLLGLLFPPLLLIGLFPFFYGTRKLAYASMGLGLTELDDVEPGSSRE